MREVALRRGVFFCWVLAAAIPLLPAMLVLPAGAAGEPLTVERIMARDFVGTAPESAYWSDDGRSVYYSKRRVGGEIVDLRRVDLATGRDELVEGKAKAAADYPGVWSRDYKTKAWVRDGDVFARAAKSHAPRQLTRTSEDESNPLVLLDGRIAFRRANAFYAVDLATGRQETLADLRFAKDPDEAKQPETFLEEQQPRLFRVLADRAARKEEKRAHERDERNADPSRSPRPIYFDEDRSLQAARLAPSGNSLVVAIVAKQKPDAPDPVGATGGKTDDMPVFVTDSGYVETKKVRPKVGTGKPETPALFLLDLVKNTRTAIDLSKLPGLTDDPLVELKARAKASKEAKEAKKAKAATDSDDARPTREADAAADPSQTASEGAGSEAPRTPGPAKRTLQLDELRFSEDAGHLALQLLSADKKDRWIVSVDPTTGAATPLYRQTDLGWLGWRFLDFGWTRDGASVWYLSEETGYSHLYVQPVDGPRRVLTHGPFEVDRPVLSRDGGSFFVSANREQAGIYEAYRVRLDGGPLERLTATFGIARAVPSPDEKRLLLTASWSTQPPELFVQAATAAARRRQLTESTRAEFAAIDWVVPEIVEIPSRHFAGRIQSRVYSQSVSPPARSAPAVVFVHGAGYLQNAHAGWSSYFHEFMFHTLLVRRGYVVLDMDYRASAGYGRDHRTAIYRGMGAPELEDLEDGVAWIVEHRGVDPARVGVYGGSYGGFLTLMALFRKPELFAAGAALRPVTDWAHYNHDYTAAILNTPEVDPEAYARSSPIEFAGGLSRPLLICHGMLDDNVTFQDSVRLVERLIELGKTDHFETAIYPFEPHGFKEPASWTDEYKRIFKLFETNLK